LEETKKDEFLEKQEEGDVDIDEDGAFNEDEVVGDSDDDDEDLDEEEEMSSEEERKRPQFREKPVP
jgi:hypothetical protein